MNKIVNLPSCTVMVLNWNGAKSLEMCLSSVLDAASVVGADVWVVDNDSKDGSAELCRSQFPSAQFVPLGINKSLAGYNLAARYCENEVIVALDNDVIVEKDFLLPLLSHFIDSSDIFAVTSRICVYPPDDYKTHGEATEVVWQDGMLRRGKTHESLNQAKPVFYNCGCATARSRMKFLELGGFDELFFPLYHEDIDLSWRAWKRGWTCLYEPKSVVFHACGTSMGRSEQVKTLMLRNEFLFHWKNLTTPSYVISHAATLVPRLLSAFLRGDKARLLGFIQAIKRLKMAMHSRSKVLSQFSIGDAEVVQRINGLPL